MRGVCSQQVNPLHFHRQIRQLVHLYRHQINSLPTTTLISRLALAIVVAITISNNNSNNNNNNNKHNNNNNSNNSNNNHHRH
jgi:hypothetical protein